MNNNRLSLYSIVKHISYESLTDELLQLNSEASSRLLERYRKKASSIKLKFLSYKIINSIILAIQPIFLLMAYLDLNLALNDNVHFQIVIFINSVNFQFFFVSQFFNFLLMGLFNLISIMTGNIYDWVKTLPLSRNELKKLVFYTIYHKINLPIITNVLAFPLIIFIATQNVLVFLISIGVSIMNLIFSLSIMIILGEKIARFMKKHNSKSRKPLFIQLINSFSYILIIFGGIFIIEIALNYVIPLLLNSADLFYTPLYNITLFLIPFPFNVSYLISVASVLPQMPIFFWLNLSYGFVLYLIIIYYLIRRSIKSLGEVISSKSLIKSDESGEMEKGEVFKIHTNSHFNAFIRKDLLTASRDLQTSMYFIMPVIMSITFIFFFNIILIGGNVGLTNNFLINNWVIMLGINPVLSATIVNSILNIDTSGKTPINILPIIRRDQARSKLALIILIQILVVITPALIYIFYQRFKELLFTFFNALPFIIIFSLITYILRIRLFGKKKYYYTLDEYWPENKIGKWTLILVVNYLLYIFFIFISYYFIFFFGFSLFVLNQFCLTFVLAFIFKVIFDKFFPKKSKTKWSLILPLSSIYSYIFFQLLLLNTIIPFAIEYVIPIILVALTGLILLMKYLLNPKKRIKKKVRKEKTKSSKKKEKEKENWTIIILIVAILFYTYTLFPIFITVNPMLYILIDIYLILIGFALIPKILKTKKPKSEKRVLEKDNFFQIDFLKAMMIFLVIFDHTIPWSIKNELGVALWERISIPVFLVIMGYNFGISYKNRGSENFGLNYLYRKFSRYLLPFILLYIVSIALGIYFYGNNIEIMLLRQHAPFEFIHIFIGIIPFWGPGNWFIPVLFGGIIILPIIFKGFSGKKIWALITLLMCFLIEIGIQYFVYSQLKPFTLANTPLVYMFLCNTLFYTSAIGLGMWFSINHKIFSWNNIFMWIVFPLSLIYLIAYQFFNFRFVDANGVAYLTGDYNYLVIPYSAFLVLLALRFLPKTKKGITMKTFSVIGKSTYHIFLTQILYFAILIAIHGEHYGVSILGVATDNLNFFINLCVNWSICVPIGVIWWSIENSIRNFYKARKALTL